MNKYKKLASNTLIFSLGSFSSKILSIFLLRLYTQFIPKSDFSVVNQIQNIINLLGPIVTLSISESILRFGLDKKYDNKKVYSTGVFTGFAGLAVGMIILWIVAAIPKFGFKEYLPYMMLFLFTSEFRWMQQQYAKVKNYIKLYTADSILSTLTLFLFSLLFIAIFKLGIKGYILAIVFSDLTSVVFLAYCANMKNELNFKLRDNHLRLQMIQYSAPLIPTSVLWWVVSSSDSFMVAGFISHEVNGLYSAAYKIPNLISLISIIFYRAWQMSAISEYGSAEQRRYYTKVFDAYTSMMFVASSGIMLMLKTLTTLLVSEEYRESYRMAPFLVVAVLMQSFCNFLGSIYNASNQNKNSLWTSAIAALTNIVLNLILIPIVGVQGAAFATMFAYFVCFIIRVVDTQRIAKFSVSWRKMGVNLCVIMFSAIMILADVPLMHFWLFLSFAVMALVNHAPIQQTAKKLLSR
ncbi:MAG: hypothetical protein E7505_01850 [Ruminococcus sp.]|nr:hypothetical protein [Ruminococcus sp.]